MKLVPKHLILAGMLAYAGLSAQAQTPTDAPKGPPPAGHEHRGGPGGKFDPAKMQAPGRPSPPNCSPPPRARARNAAKWRS